MSGLHSLIERTYAGVLSDPTFRLTLESHRRFFLQQGNYEVHMVDDHKAYKYRYDLQGYLTSVGIPMNLHFIVMRLNGMTSPTEFNFGDHKGLLVPTQSAFSEVLSRYKTSMGATV